MALEARLAELNQQPETNLSTFRSNITMALEARLAELNQLQDKLDAAKGNYNEALDTIWLLLATALVFFMHSGFSLLEAGSVRFKNAQNILAKNLIVVTVGFLCWYAIGYPIAFGMVQNPNNFSGGTNFFMDGFWEKKETFRFWIFQGAFCATGGTIVSGAMAERTQLKGFVTYTIFMTTFIYPLVVYWAWSGKGFLNYTNDEGVRESVFGAPFLDFAGSGLVHLVGGVGALCGALIVGPRVGWCRDAGPDEFDAHSVPLCVLGTFFLWFGWYGFNPGSTMGMHTLDQAYTAGLVAVNTTISPCFAGLMVFFLRARVVQPKRLDIGGFCNGILAGLVAVTAGCANIKPWESAIIGLVGGGLYQAASMMLKRPRFGVDDVVDAFAVHGVNGFWGSIAAGLFGNPAEGIGGNGSFYGGNQLPVQIIGALLILLWSGSLSVLIFMPLRLFGLLRMSDNFQAKGADMMEHSPAKAYTAADTVLA
eukprot:CAMPEP_0204114724 /NCGR_PEP_ID=MMETSP0361-20130328/4426_1 /ASSEMBLY_ACC=CAM_ASM_000343 /TAXON_ID=268821 /ORGANISM="Scrippsiella Hangoei, Strain SHTV-5" /LENGTH=479 /DNA_ID=CAMNT_0051065301 /DNA_START=20 /DNA_END=1459 /DNA_ORIENTATION=+